MTLSPEIEPAPHWWEANASPLRHNCSPNGNLNVEEKENYKTRKKTIGKREPEKENFGQMETDQLKIHKVQLSLTYARAS